MNDDVTTLLERWQNGDQAAAEELFDRIYPSLHALAASRLRPGGEIHRLQTTELANDVYMKLAQQSRARWRNRDQFFAIAARITRRTIIDFVKHQRRQKRGGGWEQVTVSDLPDSEAAITDVLTVNECIDRLADVDALAAQVVEMRYFGDLTVEEVAHGLGVSERTVARRWRFARAWLKECVRPSGGESREPTGR